MYFQLFSLISVTEIDINLNSATPHIFHPNIVAAVAKKYLYAFSTTAVNDGAKLQWENSDGDETFLTLIGYDDHDFSSIGGLVNPNTAGNANGDVNIVIPTHTAGDTYSIISEWIKYYA